ncbi:CDP-alcohol phosphatidyltransferase family protein [Populibacterium corticicola]|uniref:CDP-alcohol phosphatidyltransferase family protein n=1 Tax=Populibacterium corticicola TaxID=1812826 RepID=A0ABW5XD74_9MICO
MKLTKEDLTIPNLISAFRLLLIPVFAVLASLEHDLAALIVVAVSSISDWADGYIARRFNQVSELGKSLDPIADRCFILVTFVVLVVREEIPIWLLLLVVGRDLVMAILVSLVARSGHRPMAVTYVGKAATLCLLVAMPLFLLATLTADASTFSDVARVLAWIFALIGVVLYWASAIQYLRRGVTLLRVRPEVDNV